MHISLLLQLIVIGIFGDHGDSAQRHVVLDLGLAQDPRTDHFMEELIAQVLYRSHPHAILTAALVNINWWTSHYSNTLICVHNWFTVDCTWDPWGSWSSCSKTCGSGTMSHSRSKNGPYHGGSDCTGSSSESTSCNTNSCPGKYSKVADAMKLLHKLTTLNYFSVLQNSLKWSKLFVDNNSGRMRSSGRSLGV